VQWLKKLIVIVGVFALVVLPIGAVVQIVLTSQFDDRSQTQAIVVLDSGRYWGDPKEVRRARWAHAAELYNEKVAPVIVVTGPQRALEPAKQMLTELGVPVEDVVIFPTTADTWGSLRTVSSVMRDLGWQSATLVTDPPLAARAGSIATGLGMDAHLSPTRSGPATALTSEYVGGETVALLRYYVMHRFAGSDFS
jgi:uncharacterized SAM-binding protein YcdF (DUF218 family)